ncbi:MAG: tRNA 2-thiouridine(34) synthase MnmA [Chloroflexi bacterium]|nr:tRNA 2-thiouridine(34) synthase MnmA [Chloroflexota bacterium]
MSDRVFVAMSGGVDSSVAAAMLAERGEDVVGVWMRLTPDDGSRDAPRCCGTDQAGEDARRAASRIGIPFYALDYAEVFARDVVDPFVAAYAMGETPNPCVACNSKVKFEALLRDVVAKFGGSRIATGHYARVTRDDAGRAHLLRARDPNKDQSYALYMLGQRELARIELPIGELADKSETRAIAQRFELSTADKAESMDICFIGGDYREFVRERVPEAFVSGPVERGDGIPVGTHGGIGTLTVGQRAGVGIATGERLYVLRLETDRNAAIVGRRDEGATMIALRDVTFTGDSAPSGPFSSSVALRYRGAPQPCTVVVSGRDATIELSEPALVAGGQAAVFYDGDEVLGGGTVTRALAS